MTVYKWKRKKVIEKHNILILMKEEAIPDTGPTP